RHVASVLLPELVAAPLSSAGEAAIAREIDEPRFPAVEIAAAERRFQAYLAAEAADRSGVDEEVVAFGSRRRRQIRERVQRADHPVDLGLAIDPGSGPGMREVAPLSERAAGRPQPIDRPFAEADRRPTVRGRARSAQRASKPLG